LPLRGRPAGSRSPRREPPTPLLRLESAARDRHPWHPARSGACNCQSILLSASPMEPTYRERVPAVARAVQALEHLASAQQPMSLTALSRAVAVGPSSLLAILTTLKGLGLVSRAPRDG